MSFVNIPGGLCNPKLPFVMSDGSRGIIMPNNNVIIKNKPILKQK